MNSSLIFPRSCSRIHIHLLRTPTLRRLQASKEFNHQSARSLTQVQTTTDRIHLRGQGTFSQTTVGLALLPSVLKSHSKPMPRQDTSTLSTYLSQSFHLFSCSPTVLLRMWCQETVIHRLRNWQPYVPARVSQKSPQTLQTHRRPKTFRRGILPPSSSPVFQGPTWTLARWQQRILHQVSELIC